MFESYKEEVTFNEERGSEDFDPQNEFYQEDMEESFKKDITSIGRRLIVYMLVFFFSLVLDNMLHNKERLLLKTFTEWWEFGYLLLLV